VADWARVGTKKARVGTFAESALDRASALALRLILELAARAFMDGYRRGIAWGRWIIRQIAAWGQRIEQAEDTVGVLLFAEVHGRGLIGWKKEGCARRTDARRAREVT